MSTHPVSPEWRITFLKLGGIEALEFPFDKINKLEKGEKGEKGTIPIYGEKNEGQ